MRTLLLALAASTALIGTAGAATVYPLDRATILAGSPFDFKVEFDGQVKAEDVKIVVNGGDYKAALGSEVEFVASEKGKDDAALGSAVLLRGVKIDKAGAYTVEVSAGDEKKSVTWDVYATGEAPKAKNIIFLLGDGLSVSHRTAARLMSKGMTEGKANGRLAMDDLDHMAFIGTSSTGSIATDSANTMSAYMTGHKSAVNALGVYADRTPDSFDDPKVETFAEALRRTTKKSVGVISTAELEDATPAAVVSHTRKRADKPEIVDMFWNVKPEVVLGGGSAYFLSKDVPGSKRKDDKDYIKLFQEAGYKLATDKTELEAAASADKILGLFHTGNMDYALDRLQLKKGTVDKFPNQPGLVEMTKVALDSLSKNPEGFFLMVEGASIDKASHPLDWDRAVYDTIEFDQAIAVAREFQANNPDTLVVVTGDHTHGVSIIGTIDDDKPGTDMREKVGTYDAAGFPNYQDADGDGYPDRVDVSRRLAIFANNGPDHYETFRPKLDGPFEPAVKTQDGIYVANEAYKDVPGAVFVEGNIPRDGDTGVHAVDDVVLQAAGPGAEEFKGYMEQSDVYRVLADTFAIGVKQ
ncbi:alkaline phosphatase [Pleomorphomonas carboxyditropha]|uniref:Alkaline phosphatase n=1 Tax=Pleomorphomonas carboxyditropha TaxID=2023338 RepID=A0A2G9WVJ2_9HYPH|nr:alkaline phosphatase [Pleomorphomonas carboxyditropha]PIO98726.1 alkaline phosphatase [Pleomorphomonas carboxyditropha]